MLGDCAGSRVQPLHHGTREVLVRTNDSRGGVTKLFVVDSRFGVHHLVEGIAIPVVVAELEPCRRARGEDVLVVGEPIELPGKRVLADLLQRRGGRVHQQLQRGQALLAVDDAAWRSPRIGSCA